MGCPSPENPPRFEFHVSRRARDRYGFDDGMFSATGNVVFADFRSARVFADRMNSVRDVAAHPERTVRASEINAMGLIDEMLHVVFARYRQQVRPTIMRELLGELEQELGGAQVEELLTAFIDEFPPVVVYRGEVGAAEYLAGTTGGTPHREVVLEELVLLRLANTNPAFAPFRELFDDSRLRRETSYDRCVETFEASLAERPGLEGGGQTLLDLLLSPVRAAPTSLEGQLAFIRNTWAGVLGDVVLRILQSLDFVAEETRPFFGPGPGPVEPPDYTDLGDAPERYSPDRDWMPRLVLLAKNVHVWLDQLSRRHGYEIATLDRIPDEELDRLAGWGFTGLWLIGVWQRSRASETIKRWMGDHEAVASAYSLADYAIADDLGGEWAYDNLKARAWERGIRMSTDMVPNHMGIDSRWVIEHPDWFVGLDHSPFPAYRFSGADLCDDERVGIYLEDGYWNRSDAAVVFRRVDHWTADERFIYHGNDGTSMPWNDTAQLDYRKAEVREAVIQTILHVARRSPIIRFDAAMTLAKQHYQRLWFPEPGSGGDIPSRAEHGMTRAAFDEVMPEEFWREVVDRVAAEAPDTLLLAEAFWLLEGYFVRTLGMHRVYNSAFMNMLRDERNADYRLLIKSTLEYDPQILKRYVNFMSNPDERTAVDQFGTDGKYFGVATMMATLPGLPMFGHGQVEGFAEKYGMEFRRPRWAEEPDDALVRRHERQLFPLLHRRRSFAEVDRFLLYDFERETGGVDENVFAYSNDVDGDRSLVVFHNTFSETRGRLRQSTSKIVRHADNGAELRRFGLAEGLGVSDAVDRFVAFRDAVSGLEYLRPGRRLVDEGLVLTLDAYRYHVFVDFRQLDDDDQSSVSRLESQLQGCGVDSVDLALAELRLVAVLEPFGEVVSAERMTALFEARAGGPAEDDGDDLVGELLPVFSAVLDELSDLELGVGTADVGDPDRAIRRLRRDLELLHRDGGDDDSGTRLASDLESFAVLVTWLVLRRLRGVENTIRRLLERVARRQLGAIAADPARAEALLARVRVLLEIEGWWAADESGEIGLAGIVAQLLETGPVRDFLGINLHGAVLWYRAEAFDDFVALLRLAAVFETGGAAHRLADIEPALDRLDRAGAASGYRVERLIDGLERS